MPSRLSSVKLIPLLPSNPTSLSPNRYLLLLRFFRISREKSNGKISITRIHTQFKSVDTTDGICRMVS